MLKKIQKYFYEKEKWEVDMREDLRKLEAQSEKRHIFRLLEEHFGKWIQGTRYIWFFDEKIREVVLDEIHKIHANKPCEKCGKTPDSK